MSDEQLDETSVSQGHATLGICDGVRIFMCGVKKKSDQIRGGAEKEREKTSNE